MVCLGLYGVMSRDVFNVIILALTSSLYCDEMNLYHLKENAVDLGHNVVEDGN